LHDIADQCFDISPCVCDWPRVLRGDDDLVGIAVDGAVVDDQLDGVAAGLIGDEAWLRCV